MPGRNHLQWLRQYREKDRWVQEHRPERDLKIYEAAVRGYSRRLIAEAIGLSPSQVQRIIDKCAGGERKSRSGS